MVIPELLLASLMALILVNGALVESTGPELKANIACGNKECLYLTQQADYETAEYQCGKEPGLQLAVVENKFMDSDVLGIASSKNSAGAWISGKFIDGIYQGNYETKNWAIGEPNPNIPNGCVGVKGNPLQGYKWYNLPCEETLDAICSTK